MDTHLFQSRLVWTGAGAAPFEYTSYARDLQVELPGRPPLLTSAASAFLGDASRYNPEDMILASASACHALTFLAIAAKARLEVLSYADEATAVLGPVDGKYRITEMTLRPRVVFARGVALERTESLQAKAHENCFIARSVAFPIKIEPTHTHPTE